MTRVQVLPSSTSNDFFRRFLLLVSLALVALIRPASSLLRSSSSSSLSSPSSSSPLSSSSSNRHPVWTSRSAAPAFSTAVYIRSGKRNPEDDGDGSLHVHVRTNNSNSRRELLGGMIVFAAAAAATTTTTSPAHAFSNAIPEAKTYKDRAKRRGNPPKDLGVLPRTTEGIDGSLTAPGLRTCDGNPNCFSTTGDELLEDRQQHGVDFLVAPWVPPGGETRPIRTIAAVVAAYEPGQGGVDGGGFALVKETDNYLYYQFEALKKGYIDDLEFAAIAIPTATATAGGVSNDNDNDNDNAPVAVQVRSASRVGVTDFGVNAVRLNYISGKLRAKGWSIAEITPETHRDYWVTANEAREATFDADRRNMD
mmetsp:Transcript_21191/g.46228  ORF Transcript_21191/g.46228 Transcript_21191/m.46228 type:complete len:366 (+) Transcript_21191:60-1157(+)